MLNTAQEADQVTGILVVLPSFKHESSTGNGINLLHNRADPGLILLLCTNKRPTVLALSAKTCEQVAVSTETAMGCRRIRFLQAERDIIVPYHFLTVNQ